jgi:serine/threonine-protein kinase
MNRRRLPALSITVDQETVRHPAPNGEPRPLACCPRRDSVAGSGPHLTKETEALLRLRLRAAAFILLIGFGVFLIRHVASLFLGEEPSPVLLIAHVLVVLVLGVCAAPLCRDCTVSLKKLRFSELIIFGLPAAFFLMLQHRNALEDAGRGITPPAMPFWVLLICTYGMFIPNTWRRAAVVTGVMALAPVLLIIGMALIYPQVAAVMRVMGVVQHVLVLGVAAAAAVFGTHLINKLRREVYEAKQIGQYRLIEQLGTGGMGDVYLAEHRMLKRPCALKLIHPERAGDPRVLARFEREVRATARLSHWNTVEIFDYGRTDDGTFYYVMEYLPGLSLEALIKRHGPLPAERVVHLVRQVCQALREAHAIGLIHRDIKPGNVFAAERGGLFDVAKLLDFGLVKPLADPESVRLTLDGAISGTPLFMSPEQARGRGEVDARSDIYSLGAVTYALLTGRPPFGGSHPMDVVVAQIHEEPTRPSQHQPDVPADLEAVVLRCLAKRPEDRYENVDQLEQALSECAAADRWTQAHAARWWQEHDQPMAPTVEQSADRPGATSAMSVPVR